jgi:hypothetical protein
MEAEQRPGGHNRGCRGHLVNPVHLPFMLEMAYLPLEAREWAHAMDS